MRASTLAVAACGLPFPEYTAPTFARSCSFFALLLGLGTASAQVKEIPELQMGRTIYRLKKVRKVNGEKSPGMLFFEGRPGWKVAPFITKSTEGVKLFLALHVEHLPQRWRFTYAPVIIVVDGDLHRYGPLEWPFYDSTALSFPTAEVAFKVTPEDPGAIADGKQVYLTVEAGTQFSLKLTAEQQADFRLILDKYKALAPTKETEPKKEGSQ